MGINTTEAQLIIRARQIGQQNIDATTASLAKLNDQLAKQVAAAAKGEASSKELAATYDQLLALGNSIIQSQVAQIDKYNSLAAAVDKAQAKADALRQKTADMAKAQADAATVTATQANALTKLQKRTDAADASVARATANLDKQGAVIERVGGNTNDLAAFQERVAESVRNVGTSLAAVGELMDGYDAHLLKIKEDEAFLADDAAFLDRVAAAKRLTTANQFFAEYEADLQRLAAAEKEAGEVQAFNQTAEQNAKLVQQAQYVRDLTAAFNEQEAAQRKLVALQQYNATGSAASVRATQTASGVTAVNTSPTAPTSLSGQLQSILDPSAAARSSLSGLEAEIARVTASVGDAEKPMRDYVNDVNDLSRIQNATTAQAKLVDSYSTQAALVAELNSEYTQNLAAVQRRASAIANATEIEDGMVEELTREQSELAASSAALSTQTEKLNALGAALAGAGIDVNNLANAEERLKGVAVATGAAVTKLNSASTSRGGAAQGSFLGLKPYDIQNLSYQLNDVFTQISSGTSITQTLAQQGGQIAQIPGLLKAVVTYLPEIAAVVAVLGSFYLLLKRTYDLSADAREFNAQLSATADAANYNAAALALNVRALEDLGIANADAVASLKTFIHDGVDSTKLDQFAASALALSRVMGVDLPTAAKTVSAAFTGGYEDIVKLDQAYNFLSVAQRQQIRDDFNSNQGAQGRLTALDAFSTKMDDAANKSRTTWSKAWTDLGVAFNGFLDFYYKFADLDSVVQMLDKVGVKAQQVVAWLNKVTGAGSGAPGTGTPGTPSTGLGVGTGADTVQANQAQQKAANDYIANLRIQLTQQQQLDDATRIHNAGQLAYNAAEDKHLGDVAAETARILEMENERRKIGLERLQQEQQLASALKSSVIAAGAANPDDLAGQLAANAATRQQQQLDIDKARTEGLDGLPAMGGMTLDQAGKVFDKQKQLADLQTNMTYYQTQQNELMRQYDDLVNKALSDYANHSIDAAGAAKEIVSAQQSILPVVQKNAAAAVAFGKGLEPSPKAAAFIAQFADSGGNLLAKGTTDAMKLLDDAVTKAQEAQTTALSSIQQKFNENTESGSQAIQDAADAQAKLTPEIISAAKAAQDFAKAMNSVTPNPQLQATIQKYQTVIDNANNSNPKSSVVGKFDIGVVNADEQKLNQTIQDRNTLVETYNQLVDAGAMTASDAEDKTKALYENTAPVIQAQIKDIQAMIDTLKGKDGADLPMLDALNAKLQLASAQTTYIDKQVQELGKTINESIANEAVTAFDSAGQAIGNAIAGTESWSDAFGDLGRAAANFFAGLLKDIAEAIIKMEILSALGISGNSNGGGGFGGAIAGALIGGSGTTAAAGAAGTATAAASSGGWWSWLTALFHTGTSSSASMTRSGLSPDLWDSAPRYHDGTPGAGLSSGEIAAVLKDSEEVLTADNPRHIRNVGKGMKGSSGNQTALKQVLLLDPKDIAGVMATPDGTDAFLSVIRSNKTTIKKLLG